MVGGSANSTYSLRIQLVFLEISQDSRNPPRMDQPVTDIRDHSTPPVCNMFSIVTILSRADLFQ